MLLEQLWDSEQGVLSTQVLQELCINLRRKISHPLPVDEVRLLIRDYAAWEVVTNTPESVLQVLDISTGILSIEGTQIRRLTGGMGRVVCAAAERALKSDLNQQGFLFESSIVTVNHFDYTANGVGCRAISG
jgi:predicted nucleic acid-binding protein